MHHIGFTLLLADGGKVPKPNKSAFDPKTSKESGRAEGSIVARAEAESALCCRIADHGRQAY
ncbi:hypothetical protein [Nocardia salmonicida]|uniref:hypothetical protein n=1 Tax=Nocardia salmonicida TaxID=53431 RepID=UPI0037963424